MKVPAGTRGEPFYRVADGDTWEAWEYRCDTCGEKTPWGVDQCELCVEFERDNPPFGKTERELAKEMHELDLAYRARDLK